MMTTCRDYSDDKVGITAIFDFRYYSWSSEHQDYDSGDRQCITLNESLGTMNTFLMTNESQVCELCVSMFRNNDTGLSRSI